MVTIWRDSVAESSEIYDSVHDRANDRACDSVGEDKSLNQTELSGNESVVEKKGR